MQASGAARRKIRRMYNRISRYDETRSCWMVLTTAARPGTECRAAALLTLVWKLSRGNQESPDCERRERGQQCFLCMIYEDIGTDITRITPGRPRTFVDCVLEIHGPNP